MSNNTFNINAPGINGLIGALKKINKENPNITEWGGWDDGSIYLYTKDGNEYRISPDKKRR